MLGFHFGLFFIGCHFWWGGMMLVRIAPLICHYGKRVHDGELSACASHYQLMWQLPIMHHPFSRSFGFAPPRFHAPLTISAGIWRFSCGFIFLIDKHDFCLKQLGYFTRIVTILQIDKPRSCAGHSEAVTSVRMGKRKGDGSKKQTGKRTKKDRPAVETEVQTCRRATRSSLAQDEQTVNEVFEHQPWGTWRKVVMIP